MKNVLHISTMKWFYLVYINLKKKICSNLSISISGWGKHSASTNSSPHKKRMRLRDRWYNSKHADVYLQVKCQDPTMFSLLWVSKCFESGKQEYAVDLFLPRRHTNRQPNTSRPHFTRTCLSLYVWSKNRIHVNDPTYRQWSVFVKNSSSVWSVRIIIQNTTFWEC